MTDKVRTSSSLLPHQIEMGIKAVADLHRRSGSKQFRRQDVNRVIKRWDKSGWSTPMIAEALGISERMVQYYKSYEVNPKKRGDGRVSVAPKYKDMLEYTPEAFETWFLEFSPYDYLPQHAKSWITAFMTNRNLMLNVPPGHAKSEFFMIWIPVWLICRDRNVQILMVSNSAQDAGTWALEVAGQLEHNEHLIEAYGAFVPENIRTDFRWTPAQGTFTVRGRTKSKRGAQYTVESRGMTGRVLGRRADYILVDDPTKQEDAASDTARTTQIEHLRQQVFSRAEPNSTIMVIGQRVHVLDMYGELERQERVLGAAMGERFWHVEKYPAILRWPIGSEYRDPDDDPEHPEAHVLWPERWPYKELVHAFESVGGEQSFFCMFQQEPAPESMAVFKETNLVACRDYERGAGVGARADGFFPIVKVVSVDPSPAKFNAIVVGDLLYNRHQFMFAVTEIHRMQASLPELKAMVDTLIEQHRPDYFIFEESGFLMWLRDDPWFMELKGRVNFLLHKTTINKNSREYGLQSLAGDFEFRRISLPYGDETARQMTTMLHNEAVLYPSSATNDILMALWFIKYNYDKLTPKGMKESYRTGQGSGWAFLRQLRKGKGREFQGYQREYAKIKERSDA